ncbi:hypothetical protein EsDP_00005689 [Epichloe bromicola]|uniref:Uncharacterized protein n=1 Tax=Epichloe bromicola TaxID=79588 RepID=A0ABQ0CVF7_9HYPO
MRFQRAFFEILLATAVYGAAIPPHAAGDAPNTLLEHGLAPINPVVDLIRHRRGGSCLFHFPLFAVNRHDRQSLQTTIDESRSDTYDFGDDLEVTIMAEHVKGDRHIGVVISNAGVIPGSIVLSNYRDTLEKTPVRETIEIDYSLGTKRTCVRLPRLDGTWYIQRSL